MFFSAVVTAMGRFRSGDEQALSSRYLTPGAVAWAVLGIAVAIVFNVGLRPAARTAAAIGLARVAVVIGVSDEALGIVVMTNQTVAMLLASDAYVVGVEDRAALDGATTNIPLAWSVRPFLEDHGLGPFSEAGPGWLGRPVSALFGGRTYAGCLGAIDKGVPAGEGADTGVVLDGWAWSGRDGLPSRVLVVDAAGMIVGLARAVMERPDVRAVRPEVASDLAGFRGHARASSAEELRLIAISRDGRAVCEVGGG